MHTSTPPPTPPPGSPPRSPGELRFHVGESEVTTAHGELLPRLADEPAAGRDAGLGWKPGIAADSPKRAKEDIEHRFGELEASGVGSAETNREIAERLEREARAEMNREIAEQLEREIAATRLKVNASPARDASLLAPKFLPPPPSPREGWRLEALRSPPKPDAIDEAAVVPTRDAWLLRLLTCVVAVDGAGDAEAVRGGRFLLALYKVMATSQAAVWLRCRNAPAHGEYRAVVAAVVRTKGGCPECAGTVVTKHNSLKATLGPAATTLVDVSQVPRPAQGTLSLVPRCVSVTL